MMRIGTAKPETATADAHRLLCGMASRLLRYPDETWREHAALVREVLEREMPVSPQVLQLLGFVADVDSRSLEDWQELYVRTFDLNPDTPLNLTAVVFGEEKDRGRTPQRGYALVQLGEAYASAGYELSEAELPDYLPALLEFVAHEGCRHLERYLPPLLAAVKELAERTERAASPYAPVLRVAHDAMSALARPGRGTVR